MTERSSHPEIRPIGPIFAQRREGSALYSALLQIAKAERDRIGRAGLPVHRPLATSGRGGHDFKRGGSVLGPEARLLGGIVDGFNRPKKLIETHNSDVVKLG